MVLEGPPLQPAKQLALLLFPLLSRWAMVVLLGAFPYARSEGLGSPFHQGGARIATLAAALTALAVSVVLGGFGGLGLLLGVTALALVPGLGNGPGSGRADRRLLRRHQRVIGGRGVGGRGVAGPPDLAGAAARFTGTFLLTADAPPRRSTGAGHCRLYTIRQKWASRNGVMGLTPRLIAQVSRVLIV